MAERGGALTAFQRPDGGGRGGRPNSNTGLLARCGCSRRIRVSPQSWPARPMICGLCGSGFEAAVPLPGT